MFVNGRARAPQLLIHDDCPRAQNSTHASCTRESHRSRALSLRSAPRDMSNFVSATKRLGVLDLGSGSLEGVAAP